MSGHCGALVWLFAKHLLWGLDFPTTLSQLEAQACQLRKEFAASLGDQCIRPRLAALRLSLADRLAEVLVERGVGSSESLQGGKDVIHHLGEDHVGKALHATNIWRELKWLANQQRPPLLLIRPSEFQNRKSLKSEVEHSKWATKWIFARLRFGVHSPLQNALQVALAAQFRGPPELFP